MKSQLIHELLRRLDINHAVEVLSHVSWSDLFASTNNIDEMVSVFMVVIDQAIPFVYYRKKRKSTQTRLPKNIRKLIYKKKSAGKHCNNQIRMIHTTTIKFKIIMLLIELLNMLYTNIGVLGCKT